MRPYLLLTTMPVLIVGLTASLPRALIAASPRSLSLTMPSDPVLTPPAPLPAPAPPAYQPAPLPNRDVDTPSGPRATNDTTVGPSLFTRSDTYRGDGFNQGSTAQSEQDKRSRPAPGFSLRMPLTGN